MFLLLIQIRANARDSLRGSDFVAPYDHASGALGKAGHDEVEMENALGAQFCKRGGGALPGELEQPVPEIAHGVFGGPSAFPDDRESALFEDPDRGEIRFDDKCV